MVGLQYHIRCKPGDVGDAVLLPGDPGRSEVIARQLQSARLVARNREFVTYTGLIDGRPISVCSTGIGSPSTAIALEELAAIGATTFVRVGTTGSIQRGIGFGHLVVATAAVRDEGTTPAYVPLGYPAVSDHALVSRMLEAGGRLGYTVHAGIVRSHDALYPDLQPGGMPRQEELVQASRMWQRARVVCNDMESSTLFTIAGLRGLRAGAILTVVNEPGEEEIDPGRVQALDLTPMFQVAIEAIRRLQPAPAPAA
ncbi:MAG TPA: nucleoside phosphorylase [Candidatus Limnocylindrales bacterium]|nr:nucleoside phosphorylase [Candidatus Limnocylindrales bacterium]